MAQNASNSALPGELESEQTPETEMEESHETSEEGSASTSMAVDAPPLIPTFTSTTSTTASSTASHRPTGVPLSEATGTPIWLSSSDRGQTSLSVVESMAARQYPRLHVRASQQHHLPLPEREDSSRPRPITFGSLKKASMSTPSNGSEGSAGFGNKKSKMIHLPSYLRHTTFSQHFQPEGTTHDLASASPSLPEREHSKRRRLADNRRRQHTHFHQHSDSSSSGSSSDGSDSGHSSHELSGTSTPIAGDTRPLRYQLPSRWSTVDKNEKTELLEDDLLVHYTGPGIADSDASAIRANRPIPPQCGIYYYEVFIKSKGDKGYIGIGVCNSGVALDRLPGWEPQSWGYHGDDGNSFGGCGNGRPFGPVFTTGDTIGCGVNFRDMSLFYTKNGAYLGVAFRDLKGPLYPTVGMRTVGEIVEANFGQREFLFDIEEYVKEEKVEAWQALEDKLQRVAVEQNQAGLMTQDLSDLVLTYMIHHGYSESARQFSKDLAPPPSSTSYVPQRDGRGPQDDVPMSPVAKRGKPSLCMDDASSSIVVDAERRKNIRIAIMAGEIDCAMKLLEEQYPGIMNQNEDMLLKLRCRKFVEMVNSSSSHLKALDEQEKASGSNRDMEMADTNGHTHNKTAAPQLESTPEPMDVDQAINKPTSRKKGKMVEKSVTPTEGASEEGLEGLGRLKDAIKYGQYLQEQYKNSRRSSIQDMLIDSFSVLAYSDHEPGVSPTAAPVSKPVSRESVADTVNTAILASQNLPTTAPLEVVYRQTRVLLSELMRRGVGEAAFFDLSRDCLE